MTTLAQQHDCLLLDLDGTVFRGARPVPGAAETLTEVGARTFFVTNNASRSPAEVAAQLRELGFSAEPDDIATSAQAAARLLACHLPPHSAVLVVGTEALAAEVSGVGLRPVRQWSDAPVAVVQGHSPRTGWADLAEAALAIRGGARWVATNVDVTLPTERGLLPGNGAMVAALRVATEHEPEVAGKPQPTLVTDVLSRGDFRAPLVIGDRLDTDIAAANAAGLPSLLVLSGVSTAADAVHAPVGRRPTYIACDLRGFLMPPERLRVAPQAAWQVDVGASRVTVTGAHRDPDDDGLAIVRAVAYAVWTANFDGRRFAIVAGDDAAQEALQRWSLLDPRID
jgi:HAD superfamily hydrolase (TIGR01450 family)